LHKNYLTFVLIVSTIAPNLPDEYIQIMSAPKSNKNAAFAITSPSDKALVKQRR
jgi:hypothetical protein